MSTSSYENWIDYQFDYAINLDKLDFDPIKFDRQ